MDPTEVFAELLSRDDDEIPLDRAALWLAATEYPDLDVDGALATLDGYAERLRARLDDPGRLGRLSDPSSLGRLADRGPFGESEQQAHVLADLLHGELGFRGNPEAYYDPRNSYLNDVLERRLGIPISLSAVYLEVGRRAGLALEGVGMPGHFLVRLRHPDRTLLLDPFAGGAILSAAECEARLRGLYGPQVHLHPEMLEAVATRAILFRMLNNLKGIYASQQDWARVVRTIDLLLVVEPGASHEYRDRGAAHLRTGQLRRARADFEHYLLNALDLEDAGLVREQLALIGRLESMRN